MKPTEPSLNNYSNKESCCKYPFVAVFIYAMKCLSGDRACDFGAYKGIVCFLETGFVLIFLCSTTAFTIREVCTS